MDGVSVKASVIPHARFRPNCRRSALFSWYSWTQSRNGVTNGFRNAKLWFQSIVVIVSCPYW